MKTRKYKKYGGADNKKEEEKTDERTEEELIVVDLLESLNYNFKKYKHIFDLNNFANGCPDKLLKIILGEIHDEDDNEEREKEKRERKAIQMNTKAKELAEKLTDKAASAKTVTDAAEQLANDPKIASLTTVGKNILEDKGQEFLQDKVGELMASPQAQAAEEKAKAAAGKALNMSLMMAKRHPAFQAAQLVGLDENPIKNLQKQAASAVDQKADELKGQAIKKAEEKIKNAVGGRKNRKKTRKNKFRKKKKSP